MPLSIYKGCAFESWIFLPRTMHAIPLPFSRLATKPSQFGFTLIELLTVIAIIGILMAIIIPVVGRVRDSAKSTQDMSNVRQLALAQLTYAGENKGRMAAGYDMGEPASSFNQLWQSRLLPYLSTATGVDANSTVHDVRRRPGNIFVSPNADFDQPQAAAVLAAGLGATSYRLNVNLNSWSWWTGGPRWSFRVDAPPTPSRVLLLGNASLDNVDYAMPEHESWGTWALIDIPHAGKTRANWAFADGHVQALTREQLNQSGPNAIYLWRWW